MKSLVLLAAIVSAPAWAVQLTSGISSPTSCIPSYDVIHASCSVPTGQTSSFTEKVVVRPREPSVSSNIEDIKRDYCQAPTDVKQAWAEHYHVDINSIELADGPDNQDTRIGFADDHGTWHTYRKISCTWRAQIPIFVTQVADTCAVDHVEEKNGCFAGNDNVKLAPTAIEDCRKTRPSNEAEAFVKSACLIDSYHAAQSGRLDMSLDQAKAIESTLYFMTKASKSDHLNSYINTEMGASK